MHLHQSLSVRSDLYASWHKMPFVTVVHFIVLAALLSFMANSLQTKLVERFEEMTAGNYEAGVFSAPL